MLKNYKILIVCSYNSGKISPFILEQAESLKEKGLIIDFFLIKGKGIIGYLKNYQSMVKKIKLFGPSLIHAHYGYSAILANLQRNIKVISTFHGTDIYKKKARFFSKIAMKLSIANIFVSKEMGEKINFTTKDRIIPCGVNLNIFYPHEKLESMKRVNLNVNKINILFAGSFDNKVKNSFLAKSVVREIKSSNLIELSNYSRKEVNYLLNGCDILLMTSFSEGSPQIIKEAMACNCPIISTDVGDVKSLIKDIKNCYITSYNKDEIIEKINDILNNYSRANGYEAILKYDIKAIAYKIIELYKNILTSK